MSEIHTLKMCEISIDSGQYLPKEFGKCHRFHGHTYLIRDFYIKTEGIVDFNKFKQVYALFDHYIIIPEKDKEFWNTIQAFSTQWCQDKGIEKPVEFECIVIPYEYSAVEYIGKHLKQKLLEISGVVDVKFELYETPNACTVIGWKED